jgi:ferredoxin-NADP reductase
MKHWIMGPLKTMAKAINTEATVVARKQLTSDVIELHFEPKTAFGFEPGQYISIVIPGRGPGGRDLRRAYSIASAPENPIIELCIKVVDGPGTQYLNSLNVGDVIKGTAPFGDFVWETKPHRNAIMIATGTGIAPFRSMLLSEAYKSAPPLSCRLLFGARDTSDLLYTDEMHQLLTPSHFIQALSRPKGEWHHFKGRVTDWIRQCDNEVDFATTDFYLCGNGAMITEITTLLTEKGLGKESVFKEAYYKPKAGETHHSG